MFNSRNPHCKIEQLIASDLLQQLDLAFIHPRIILIDAFVLLAMNQKRGESVEHFYGKLRNSRNNAIVAMRKNLIFAMFSIANMLDLTT